MVVNKRLSNQHKLKKVSPIISKPQSCQIRFKFTIFMNKKQDSGEAVVQLRVAYNDSTRKVNSRGGIRATCYSYRAKIDGDTDQFIFGFTMALKLFRQLKNNSRKRLNIIKNNYTHNAKK
eukprot:282070_1